MTLDGFAVMTGLLLSAAHAYPESRCYFANQRLSTCHNTSHFLIRSCSGNGELASSAYISLQACRSGFKCIPSTGACTSDNIGIHLQRAADFQIVETVIAAEAQNCSDDPITDSINGKMLCEVLHAANASQPTFGHSLGNTWETAPANATGNIDNCSFTNASGWRSCLAQNVAKQAVLITSRAPHILLNAGLMEFLHRNNVDGQLSQDEFVSLCCREGTVGMWGSGNDTCVPDVTKPCVINYYTEWGKVFMDAGIRSFFFGQSRLTGGNRQCNSDGTGCSRVSLDGVAGFAKVLSALKAYALKMKYGPVFFGPQAASGFELSNGTELADWAYGAQHLYARNGWLVQPFSSNGTMPPLAPQWYGSADLHDANRANNANNLPVMLDFDNFSGDEDRPDDIRRLASWPNATRPSFVKTLWYTMRFYNPRVTISIPFSKAAGGNWAGFNQPQAQCWGGNWGSGDGMFFSAYACNIVDVAKEVYAVNPYPTPAEVLDAVDYVHFGTALQSSDLTCVWAFRTLLDRDFTSLQEYQDCVDAIPNILIGARGAREDLTKKILHSPEFLNSLCATQTGCIEQRLEEFLCLNDEACKGSITEVHRNNAGPSSTNDTVSVMALAADSQALFGNAALIDPYWHIGD